MITKHFLVDYALGVYQYITNPVEIGSLIDEGLDTSEKLGAVGAGGDGSTTTGEGVGLLPPPPPPQLRRAEKAKSSNQTEVLRR